VLSATKARQTTEYAAKSKRISTGQGHISAFPIELNPLRGVISFSARIAPDSAAFDAFDA